MDNYKIPKTKPCYKYVKNEKIKKSKIYLLVDKIFSVYGLLLVFLYAVTLLASGFKLKSVSIVMIIGFWFVLTYFALPRFHRLLTMMYLPDYFISRTKTSDGILGDPVNIALIGSEEDIHAAMRRAGWTEADKITIRSSLGIILSTLTRKSYPAAPVSSLYLFDRKQDFAYQQEVNGSAIQRHHVRFWKVPENWTLPGGKKVNYLAAATYDRGIGLSTSTLQFTHKIDADIDKERDYIIDTILFSDNNVKVDIIKHFSSPYHDQNGGGDNVFTDGNMPIVNLKNSCNRANSDNINIQQEDTLNLPANINTLNKELPPSKLTFIGLVIILEFVISICSIIYIGMNINHFNNNFKLDIIRLFIESALQLICYILILRKYKWSRVILLSMISISATVEMINTLLNHNRTLTEMLFVGLLIIMILILTSPDVRQWVYYMPKRNSGEYGIINRK